MIRKKDLKKIFEKKNELDFKNGTLGPRIALFLGQQKQSTN